MAKFLALWRVNPNAPWPIDPAERLKLLEMMWAATDNLLKTGEQLEVGYFTDGQSGYVISTGESKDALRRASSFFPWLDVEPREVVPYETAKEVMRGVVKAQAEQMAAMKQ